MMFLWSYTLFITVLIPTYIHYYGWGNFLWLSDVGLFLTFGALWLKSPLLMSMAAVGVLIVELLWCIDFFCRLLFKRQIVDLAGYMFQKKYPFFLRMLSLFHIFNPLAWIIYLFRWGYDDQALMYMIIVYWIILFLTYNFTKPSENVNWTFVPVKHAWPISTRVWVLLLALIFPMFVFYPCHVLFKKIFPAARQSMISG